MADFFLVLFNSIWKGSGSVGHGREGYFFTENGEYAAHELSRAIGEALVQLEVLKDPEPVTMTDQELIKYAGSVVRKPHIGTFSVKTANFYLLLIDTGKQGRSECKMSRNSFPCTRVETCQNYR